MGLNGANGSASSVEKETDKRRKGTRYVIRAHAERQFGNTGIQHANVTFYLYSIQETF